MEKIKQNKLLYAVLVVFGAIAGFLYWKFVGCKSGACPLKSVWYYNLGLGVLIGYLLADTVVDFRAKRKSMKEE